MRAWWEWLLEINSPDEDVCRRGRNVIVVVFGMFVLILFAAIVWILLLDHSLEGILGISVPSMFYASALILVRRGKVTAAAALVITIMIISLGIGIVTISSRIWALMLLLTPLLLASVSLRAWQIWICFAMISVTLIIDTIVINANPQNIPIQTNDMAFVILLFGLFTLILFLGSRSLERSLQQANLLRQVAEGSTKALAVANDSLEQIVSDRTADLMQALEHVQEREARLAQTIDDLSYSQATIRNLSAPVIPILPGVLVAPLIGILDGERADILMQNILTRVRGQNIHNLILDVTGVPLIDIQVANMLIQTSQSVKLLGTRTLLVGVRPEVAQTLVALNINLGIIDVFADLQDAVLSLLNQRRLTWH